MAIFELDGIRFRGHRMFVDVETDNYEEVAKVAEIIIWLLDRERERGGDAWAEPSPNPPHSMQP